MSEQFPLCKYCDKDGQEPTEQISVLAVSHANKQERDLTCGNCTLNLTPNTIGCMAQAEIIEGS